jgi:large subunit ribosomal protein L18
MSKIAIMRRFRRKRSHVRLRKKIQGSADCPRLCVYRSTNHIYAQAVDDASAHTIAQASSLDKGYRSGSQGGGNVAAAKEIGKLIAERLKEKGIETVVFDRGGYRYHGRIRALAEAAREAGLRF